MLLSTGHWLNSVERSRRSGTTRTSCQCTPRTLDLRVLRRSDAIRTLCAPRTAARILNRTERSRTKARPGDIAHLIKQNYPSKKDKSEPAPVFLSLPALLIRSLSTRGGAFHLARPFPPPGFTHIERSAAHHHLIT